VVVIPWLCDGRFPHEASLDSDAALEEERRVFHVAVTRAEEELFLVSPRTYRSRTGGLLFMKPSQFLREVPSELVELMELDAE
jgi:DNA helicase-2/ATP-dependent DNA helicase PcrA